MKFEHFAINVEDPPAVAAWYAEHLQKKIVRHVGEPTHMHFLADVTGGRQGCTQTIPYLA